MSSALWCVTNGRAAAPPAIGCIIGVSTSRNPRSSRKRADAASDPAARAEDAAHVRVDDQVDVALAVAQLDVLEAVPLLGQRAERLGEQPELGRRERELAGPRPERLPADADDVAEVEALVDARSPRRRAGRGARGPGRARRGPGAGGTPPCRSRASRRCGRRRRPSGAAASPASSSPPKRACTSLALWSGRKSFGKGFAPPVAQCRELPPPDHDLLVVLRHASFSRGRRLLLGRSRGVKERTCESAESAPRAAARIRG